MKKVLILLGRYFPKASPNSICVKNVIDELPIEQYKIFVLAYEDYCSVEYKETVHKINRGLLQSIIYKIEESQSKGKKFLRTLCTFLIKVKMLLCIPTWPWNDPIYTFRTLKRAKKICREENIDIVLSVYMPLSSLIVGNALKKKFTNIKYIAYFLDSLSGGYVPNFMRKSYYERKSIYWEKKLLQSADQIIFMASSKNYHQKLYENSKLLPKITYLDLPMIKYSMQDHIENERKSLLYVGSLPISIRSPEYILKVFSCIQDEHLSFQFVGDLSCNILNDYALTDHRIKITGKCSHDEALNYEKGAEVLVNIGNNNSNLAPSKIFEYLSIGKKIISTYKHRDDTSIFYLSKYPNALLLDENDMNYPEISRRVYEFILQDKVDISCEMLRSLYPGNFPESMVKFIERN